MSPTELKLTQLIPTARGPAPSPTITAYDAATRTYLTLVVRDVGVASVWGHSINKDVTAVSAVFPEVKFQFAANATVVGFEAIAVNGTVTPVVFFASGDVWTVDIKTGATASFANLATAPESTVLTAIEHAPDANAVYAVVNQIVEGKQQLTLVVLNVTTHSVTSIAMKAPLGTSFHEELPFEMVWLPTLQSLMVFSTGKIDQAFFGDVTTGQLSYAIENLAFQTAPGGSQVEFTKNDRLEDDDTWFNACLDPVSNRVYFQVSYVDEHGFVTINLAHIDVPKSVKAGRWSDLTVDISPMTYGYAGMEYVTIQP